MGVDLEIEGPAVLMFLGAGVGMGLCYFEARIAVYSYNHPLPHFHTFRWRRWPHVPGPWRCAGARHERHVGVRRGQCHGQGARRAVDAQVGLRGGDSALCCSVAAQVDVHVERRHWLAEGAEQRMPGQRRGPAPPLPSLLPGQEKGPPAPSAVLRQGAMDITSIPFFLPCPRTSCLLEPHPASRPPLQ